MRAGPFTLVLARSASDLARWGRMLSNCLGSFAPACAEGRSVIIGVRRDDALRYAIELTPTGVVRQFSGRANGRPRPADRRTVIGALVDRGLVDTADPANRPWLRGLE